MLGYLADAAAADGCSINKAQQLQEAAGFAGASGTAGEVLMWRLVATINSSKGASLSVLKSNLPASVSYGQIKVRMVMERCGHIGCVAVHSQHHPSIC